MSESNKKIEQPGEPKDVNIIKSLRDISFFIAVYLFFSGWVYLEYYLNFFGITIKESEIDYSQFIMYSFPVLTYHFRSFGYWAILLSVLASIYIVSHTRKKISDTNTHFLLVFIMCVLFPVIFISAKKAGTKAAKIQAGRLSVLKNVKFVLSDSFMKQGQFELKCEGDTLRQNNDNEKTDLVRLNDREELKLILSNEDKYFVLYIPDDTTSLPIVYTIKKEDVVNMKVVLENY